MQHDGSYSARAARIRIAHDDEATRLETMRRNAATHDARRKARIPFARVQLRALDDRTSAGAGES